MSLGVCWCSPMRRALVAIQSGEMHWLLQVIIKGRRRTTHKVADSGTGCQPIGVNQKQTKAKRHEGHESQTPKLKRH